MKCLLCNGEFNDIRGLSTHISRSHHECTCKEYYDLYLKQQNEEICPTCGKQNRFISMGQGYLKHCSTKCSSLDKNVQKKLKNTKRILYGEENYNNRDKCKETYLKNFGESHYMKSEAGKKIMQDSVYNKYKVKNISQLEWVKQKKQLTCLKNFGVNWPMQSEEIFQKGINTKKQKNVFGEKSSIEIYFENMLNKLNIAYEYNYKDEERYPFRCDFYLTHYDIFIEINAFPTHGDKPFFKKILKFSSPDLEEQQNRILEDIKVKAKNNSFYKNMINIWTERDVNKILTAERNKLNYIIFKNKKQIDDYFELLKLSIEMEESLNK